MSPLIDKIIAITILSYTSLGLGSSIYYIKTRWNDYNIPTADKQNMLDKQKDLLYKYIYNN